MKFPRNMVMAGLGFFMMIGLTHADGDKLEPAPLGMVLISMLSPVDPELPWSIGASPDSKIKWITNGVDTGHCGQYLACRRGQARILVEGRELNNLRSTVEPVIWDVFMYSKTRTDTPPQQVDFTPNCDASSCKFNVQGELKSSGFVVEEECKYSNSREGVILFRIYRDGKSANLAYLTLFEPGKSGKLGGPGELDVPDEPPKIRNSIELILYRINGESIYCKSLVDEN
jgi:hypothetical protein